VETRVALPTAADSRVIEPPLTTVPRAVPPKETSSMPPLDTVVW
jgi:hypothetical protein